MILILTHQVCLSCFPSSTVKGQSRNFLVEKSCILHTLVLKIGFRNAILEMWPAFVSLSFQQAVLQCMLGRHVGKLKAHVCDVAGDNAGHIYKMASRNPMHCDCYITNEY